MDILVPGTDAGALTQIVVVVIAVAATLLIVRRRAEARLLVLGVGLLVLGWMALRSLH